MFFVISSLELFYYLVTLNFNKINQETLNIKCCVKGWFTLATELEAE